MSLPSGLRRRRPMTMSEASTSVGRVEELVGGRQAPGRLPDLVVDAARGQLGVEGVEVLGRGEARVGVVTVVAGVDDDEPLAPALGLGDGAQSTAARPSGRGM